MKNNKEQVIFHLPVFTTASRPDRGCLSYSTNWCTYDTHFNTVTPPTIEKSLMAVDRLCSWHACVRTQVGRWEIHCTWQLGVMK